MSRHGLDIEINLDQPLVDDESIMAVLDVFVKTMRQAEIETGAKAKRLICFWDTGDGYRLEKAE